MELLMIGTAIPYSKAFGRKRVFSGRDDRWTIRHDVYLNIAGIEINLDEQRANVKKPEWIEGDPVVLRLNDLVVTCASFQKYKIYREVSE